MIAKKYFTAFPAGKSAITLLQNFRELLIQNLIECLNSIQSALPEDVDISFLIKKYKKLGSSKNFSPAIYSLITKLIRVASDGIVPSIIDVLHELSILNEKDISNSKFEISSILTENWERDFVDKIRKDIIAGKNNRETIILPIINPDLSNFINAYSNIVGQIKRLDFEFYQEIAYYVTRLKLFNGKGLTATTSSSVFGAIYLNIPSNDKNIESYFFEHIVHETSHLQLEILFAFDKIVLNKVTEKFKSPLRKDPRPMLGIFHATFVLCRMVRLFNRMAHINSDKKYTEQLNIFRNQFEQGLEVIEKSAVLTENGKRIYSSFVKAAEI